MTHKERVLSALARKGYDRIPVRHYAEPVVNGDLANLLGLERTGIVGASGSQANTDVELLGKLGDDLRYVLPDYIGPEAETFHDGSRTVTWPERGWPIPVRYTDKKYGDGDGTYLESVEFPFERITDPKELSRFDFPSPDWLDYSNIRERCQAQGEYAICTAKSGLDFINGIAMGRTLQQVLIDIVTQDPVYMKLMEQKFQFHYEMTERILKAAGGLVDIVHGHDDLSSQRGPLISPQAFDELFAPRYREFVKMIHGYGARFMLHVCGSVYEMIPKLIDIGVDILDVVQVAAADMDIRRLHKEFGKDLCFCGSMDVQSVLINLSVEEIIKEVELRQELFADGGLILGPSHAIQPGTPMENIIAMYRAAGSLES